MKVEHFRESHPERYREYLHELSKIQRYHMQNALPTFAWQMHINELRWIAKKKLVENCSKNSMGKWTKPHSDME